MHREETSDNQEEIGVVALNEDTNDIMFGECKWSSKPVGTEVYAELVRKAKVVQWRNEDRKEHYALFSKAGFTDEMRELAKKDDVLLFDLEAIEKALK
ncbi:ATP-binding protein [mine drainage metagenome]|uniref:ATP-binding protein n=1 Tax=mine drainage metagenome TaxID=410659 RepID=T0ZUG4_9ZZZZ